MKVVELPPTPKKEEQAKALAKELFSIYTALLEAGFEQQMAWSMLDRILDRLWFEE